MTSPAFPGDGFDPADPIVAAWANQDEAAIKLPHIDPEALAGSIAKAHRKDQLRLLWLNVQEFVPSVFVAIIFGTAVPGSPRPVAVVLAAAIVLAVGLFLVVTSVRHHLADRRWDTSMRAQVARRLAQVNHRARLYRSILWWYELPLFVAILLFLYGIGDLAASVESVFFWAFLAALFGGIYVLNRWYGRTRFESEVERLETLLADFEQETQS